MDANKILQNFLEEELSLFNKIFRQSINIDNPAINEIVLYALSAKGKYIRPILVLLVAKACGDVNPSTYSVAVAVELLHTASLIHDDIIDESKMRRGKASVAEYFDVKKAVLIGDFLLSSSIKESVKTNSAEIIKIVAELGNKLSLGELEQYILASDVIISEDKYFSVIDNKTASLLNACARMGAISVNANNNLVKSFGEIGTLLGLCFQIKDDIFDYFNRDIGKPTGNDISEGKITLPLIFALYNSPKEINKEIFDIISKKEYSKENIQKIFKFTKKYKGFDYAYSKIDEFIDKSIKIIDNIDIKEDLKIILKQLFIYFRERRN